MTLILREESIVQLYIFKERTQVCWQLKVKLCCIVDIKKCFSVFFLIQCTIDVIFLSDLCSRCWSFVWLLGFSIVKDRKIANTDQTTSGQNGVGAQQNGVGEIIIAQVAQISTVYTFLLSNGCYVMDTNNPCSASLPVMQWK